MVNMPPTRMRYRIPEELVEAVRERRAIPFVGAGFSASLGLPDWKQLLARLCGDIDSGLTFDELYDYANGDFLQIAEYLYIKSDRRIGPLRHVIEQGLHANGVSPVFSAPHVELANLGAPQIYTTNYDDLIESTYKKLGIPCAVVSLPKDVASVNDRRTQVIKYHGDLRHESTLVLTESAYYKRLDFESPMDLKFRSDLLGRSVLYMGYSFRDINIRLIWFKLMQMMQDIPESDRRPSYIIRLTPNPVLDELYRDVGLRTIVLDPMNRVAEGDRSKLLGDFLGDLATRASSSETEFIPGTNGNLFTSVQLLSRTRERLEEWSEHQTGGSSWRRDSWGMGLREDPYLRRVIYRRMPTDLQSEIEPVFMESLRAISRVGKKDIPPLMDKIRIFGPHENITGFFCRIFRGGSSQAHALRSLIIDQQSMVPWDIVWAGKVSLDTVISLVNGAESEVHWNEEGQADADIIYLADLLKRVLSGMIYESSDSGDAELLARAKEILKSMIVIYPDLKDYEPQADASPAMESLLLQVEARREAKSEAGSLQSLPPEWLLSEDSFEEE